jgi:hypothetical protein
LPRKSCGTQSRRPDSMKFKISRFVTRPRIPEPSIREISRTCSCGDIADTSELDFLFRKGFERTSRRSFYRWSVSVRRFLHVFDRIGTLVIVTSGLGSSICNS